MTNLIIVNRVCPYFNVQTITISVQCFHYRVGWPLKNILNVIKLILLMSGCKLSENKFNFTVHKERDQGKILNYYVM